MRRSDRWAFAALGIGVVAVLGGVQLSSMLDDSPAPLASKAEFCPDRPTGAARTDTRYAETAASYRGDGPHPVDLNLRYAKTGQVDIPDQWKPGSNDTAPKVQLVACVYQDGAASQHTTRTCQYTHLPPDVPAGSGTGVKVRLLEASYVFELYAAKTAEPVGRIRVPGAESCPATYLTNSGGAIFQEPDTEKLRAALRPYVERSVRP